MAAGAGGGGVWTKGPYRGLDPFREDRLHRGGGAPMGYLSWVLRESEARPRDIRRVRPLRNSGLAGDGRLRGNRARDRGGGSRPADRTRDQATPRGGAAGLDRRPQSATIAGPSLYR